MVLELQLAGRHTQTWLLIPPCSRLDRPKHCPLYAPARRVSRLGSISLQSTIKETAEGAALSFVPKQNMVDKDRQSSCEKGVAIGFGFTAMAVASVAQDKFARAHGI